MLSYASMAGGDDKKVLKVPFDDFHFGNNIDAEHIEEALGDIVTAPAQYADGIVLIRRDGSFLTSDSSSDEEDNDVVKKGGRRRHSSSSSSITLRRFPRRLLHYSLTTTLLQQTATFINILLLLSCYNLNFKRNKN